MKQKPFKKRFDGKRFGFISFSFFFMILEHIQSQRDEGDDNYNLHFRKGNSLRKPQMKKIMKVIKKHSIK